MTLHDPFGYAFHSIVTHVDADGMPVAVYNGPGASEGGDPYYATPCCGSAASINDGPMYCKKCYRAVPDAYGGVPREPFRDAGQFTIAAPAPPPDRIAGLLDIITATEVQEDTDLTRLGCRVWNGFDHDGDLDGFADELIWEDAVQSHRKYDDVGRKATYHWAVRADVIVVTYTEGDVTIVAAPDEDKALVAFQQLDPTNSRQEA